MLKVVRVRIYLKSSALISESEICSYRITMVVESPLYEQIYHFGDYYNPAHTHYNNPNSAVQCDRCNKKNIKSAIGWNNYDLCLACASIIDARSTFKPPMEFKPPMVAKRRPGSSVSSKPGFDLGHFYSAAEDKCMGGFVDGFCTMN